MLGNPLFSAFSCTNIVHWGVLSMFEVKIVTLGEKMNFVSLSLPFSELSQATLVTVGVGD